MELNIKFTASKVDEIEQASKKSIEECVSDTRVSMLTLFIQKGYVSDDGTVGVKHAEAIEIMDKYLEQHDKNELLLDIMEALMNAGFLSRELDVNKVRNLIKKKSEVANEQLDNM